MKRRIRLGLSRMSVPKKITESRHYITSLTGNLNFPAPLPALAGITTAINNLEAAYNVSLTKGTGLKSARDLKENVLDALLTQLAANLEATSGHDEAMLLTTGMPLEKLRVVTVSPNRAVHGKLSGQVDLFAKSPKGGSCKWEMCAEPLPTHPPTPGGNTWVYVGTISNGSKQTVKGLTAGKLIWFRVTIIKGKVEGDPSDPFSIIVL